MDDPADLHWREVAEAACCIWEALTEDATKHPSARQYRRKFTPMWDNVGAAGVRLWAVDNAERCLRDYDKWTEDGNDEPFDWGFVPEWLKEQDDE